MNSAANFCIIEAKTSKYWEKGHNWSKCLFVVVAINAIKGGLLNWNLSAYNILFENHDFFTSLHFTI